MIRPPFHSRFTPHRLAVAVGTALAFILTLSCVAAVGAEPTHEIKDPHYGDTLFQFYQDHYFTSLTNLTVSQQFGRVAHHAEEAEVLRGGILLSYGLLREAGEIFSRLIATNSTPRTRDRAWFYLAKISYQRGYFADSESALARIGNALPADLQEERGLLHANLLMARADYAGAAAVLAKMDGKTASARYVRYNLGVALVRSGDAARGSAILDDLGRAPAENEEFRSLRDRTNVALGFSALANNQPQAARTYLERVRLKSMETNKALLGFGWAAATLKDPKLALVPWLELAQRDVGDSSVLEAQIAVPYAYAELGAYRQSANRYNEAIAAFTREDTSLTESIAAIRAGKLIEALMANNPGDEMGWFWSLREVPAMPHASHLAQVMAQHEFQEAFKNYRDLRFLTKNLEEWRDMLTVFDDMLETRRKAFANRLPQVRERASVNQNEIDSLRQRHADLTNIVAAGQAVADGVAFADAKQRALQQRIDSVQTALKASSDNPEFAPSRDDARNRARLAAGALTWQLAQHYPSRVWQARKELDAIADELQKAQRLDAVLTQAQRDEPAHFDVFGKRIAALTPLLQAMIPRVAALSDEQQQVVQDIAIAELTRQQERLAVYSTQARFALAQMYDRGTDHAADLVPPAKEADHATKP